jgi:hypothetical protein
LRLGESGGVRGRHARTPPWRLRRRAFSSVLALWPQIPPRSSSWLISTILTASMRGRGGSIPNSLSTQRQNFFSAVKSRCRYSWSAGMAISTHLPPPVMTDRTASLALVTHILCWHFSAAASSENDHGSMNLASNPAGPVGRGAEVASCAIWSCSSLARRMRTGASTDFVRGKTRFHRRCLPSQQNWGLLFGSTPRDRTAKSLKEPWPQLALPRAGAFPFCVTFRG